MILLRVISFLKKTLFETNHSPVLNEETADADVEAEAQDGNTVPF